ncbi:site-specific integrase [Candidatus Woesearchaeota archaeon]|nr:site-specific integrase [Candidatus Woesearchaeota archaeon]
MQTLMFVNQPKVDKRSNIQNAMYQAYTSLLEEVNLILKEQNYSAHELYELLIHRGLLQPTYFKQFLKFLRWALREGYVDKNKLISKTTKGVRIPNRFTKEQLVAYFRTVDNPRTAVASFIALWSGLRIGDVIKLKIEDFDFEREIIKIVQSKRSKDRIAPFLREGQTIIEKWIKYSGATDYLFESQNCHSIATIKTPHISSKTISDGFNKVVKEANLQREDERYKLNGIPKKKFTFHTFRHTFCTHHLENEVSAAFVSRAAGHSKMDTTVGVYGHMATGNMIKAFRRSFEKGKKPKKETKKIETNQDNNPLNELAKRFVAGEMNEEIFIKKRKALEEAGF